MAGRLVFGSDDPARNDEAEIWHADVAGNYSEYSAERSKTYLRRVQTTDANGQVAFTTIYPGSGYTATFQVGIAA